MIGFEVDGSGGGGGVATVTATVPLFSSGGANPNITITQNYYDVGTNWPYSTIALAIAAATGAGDTNATIRINQNITENVTLPRGMTLTGQQPPGIPTRTLTGRISSSGGSGISIVTGLVLTGNGTQEIINCSAAGNFWITSCVFSQGSDFPFCVATGGANVVIDGCNLIGSGIATAYAFTNVGNFNVRRSSTLSIPSGLLMNMSAGSFTVDGGSSLNGTVTATGGTINFRSSGFGVTAGACINHTSGTAATIVDCNFSSTAVADDIWQGTGTINYKNVGFSNTQKGIAATLTCTPINTAMGVIGNPEVLMIPTSGNYESGIESGTGYTFFNTPTGTAFKWMVNAGQVVQLSEFGLRGTTGASIGAAPPAFKWEVSGNVTLPAAEFSNIDWDLSPDQNYAAGVIGLNRAYRVRAGTLSGNGGGTTFTRAASHAVDGPPSAGANCGIDLAMGSMVEARNVLVGASGSVIGNTIFQSGLANGQGNTGVVVGQSVVSFSAVSLGDQTMTVGLVGSAYYPVIQYSAITNTVTVNELATVNIAGAPTFSGTVASVQDPYALLVKSGISRFDDAVMFGQGTSTAAAADLVLPKDGNYFIITGNTNINTLDMSGWRSGTVLTLKFLGTPQIADNGVGAYQAFNTPLSAPIPCANNTVIQIMADGTASVWQVLSVKSA